MEPSVEELVIALAARFFKKSVEKLSAKTVFVDEFGRRLIDSPDLVMDFEEAFQIPIPTQEVENINSIGDAVNCVNRLQALNERGYL